jgi:hypothetical protein
MQHEDLGTYILQFDVFTDKHVLVDKSSTMVRLSRGNNFNTSVNGITGDSVSVEFSEYKEYNYNENISPFYLFETIHTNQTINQKNVFSIINRALDRYKTYRIRINSIQDSFKLVLTNVTRITTTLPTTKP